GTVGQLAKGPEDRALPAPLRGADLPQESLSGPRTDEARRVPDEGDRGSDPADARSGHLGQTRTLRGCAVERQRHLPGPPAAPAVKAGRPARWRRHART